MKIELATIQEIPALQDLQRKAFGPLCEELDWKDAPVLPEYQQQGIGKHLVREIQSRLPHRRAWLCTCKQVRPPSEFDLRAGFKPYKSEEVGPGLTWAYLEK